MTAREQALEGVLKIKLKFKVDPLWLAEKTYVENPVCVKVIDPEAIFLAGILGESGREMVLAGFPFIFEKALAEKLIAKGICEKLDFSSPPSGKEGAPDYKAMWGVLGKYLKELKPSGTLLTQREINLIFSAYWTVQKKMRELETQPPQSSTPQVERDFTPEPGVHKFKRHIKDGLSRAWCGWDVGTGGLMRITTDDSKVTCDVCKSAAADAAQKGEGK